MQFGYTVTCYVGGPFGNKVLDELTAEFGGATVHHGRGLWSDDNGDTVDEPNAIVTVLVGRYAQAQKVVDIVASHARFVGEECIAYTIAENYDGGIR